MVDFLAKKHKNELLSVKSEEFFITYRHRGPQLVRFGTSLRWRPRSVAY